MFYTLELQTQDSDEPGVTPKQYYSTRGVYICFNLNSKQDCA